MDEQPSTRGRSYDEPLARALGRTIKVLRTDMGLGRKDLARRAEISYSYLTEIENGTKPASNTILGPIAETLGLQLHELIALAEDRLQAGEPLPDEHGASARSSSGRWPSETSMSFLRDTGTEERAKAAQRQGVAPPSARRSRALQSWSANAAQGGPVLQPPGPSSDVRYVLLELEALLPLLRPEDQQRVLDMARRLAR